MAEPNNDQLMQIAKKIRPYTLPMVFLFLIGFIASGYYLVDVDRQPPLLESQVKAGEYTHRGHFSYIAELKNNTFYSNKRTLTPGEGPLYSNIVDNITIYYSYNLYSNSGPLSYDSDLSIEYIVVAEEAFTKTLNDQEKDRIIVNTFSDHAQPYVIETNITELNILFDELATETSVSKSAYVLKIKATSQTDSIYMGNVIDEEFVHELTIDLAAGSQEGAIIGMSEMDKMKTTEIFNTVMVPNLVKETRIYGVVAVVVTTLLLSASSIIHVTVPYVRKQKTEYEKLMDKHGKDMVKITGISNEVSNRIDVESIEELKEISEYMIKPIMYIDQSPLIQFIVLDGDTAYQYTLDTEEPSEQP